MSQTWLHLRNKNQVDSDATVAKGEISKATNEDGINTAKNTGLTNISNDVKAADAQNLQDAKDAANKATDVAGVNSALADAEKSIDGVSETFQNESGKVITNQSNDNGNDVTSNKDSQLPQTGQDNSNSLMSSIGSAILAMMIILGLGKRKKKEDK
ncbi:LPXTG cell wall anchor domain-containing protein [Fructilactobacillus sanfranciscensis]|uniref:LPXTG cell wall anchor domain-containing protein n=1 Tax=Fructilactobacillus sanfranciscensis TaxID=1625 RepID=UPI000CD3C794|nr:LPXTG cell wall anchor domain-containing protein [Fructilactobacillus sanfranciscensis]POH19064.1 hypothetical protein BGL45_05790 [Fructilactobacillus sanfranciscensis]